MLLTQTSYAQTDWRIDLLKHQEIPITPKSLKQTASNPRISTNKLDAYFKQLGSIAFKKREEAQQFLKAQGTSITSYLINKKPIANPEIKSRTNQILQHLESHGGSLQSVMTQIAAKSLIIAPNDKSTKGQFYEWFGTKSVDCT